MQDKKTEVTTIPVIEEQLEVGKKVVETGNVKISKRVKEEEVTVKIVLESEEVSIERVAVNKYVENPIPVRYEGDTMIIPVLQEVLEKRTILVEEIYVTKRKSEREKAEKINLRKEEVIIDKKISVDKNST